MLVPQCATANRKQLAQKRKYCSHNDRGRQSTNVNCRLRKRFQVMAMPIPSARATPRFTNPIDPKKTAKSMTMPLEPTNVNLANVSAQELRLRSNAGLAGHR